jgi:transposase
LKTKSITKEFVTMTYHYHGIDVSKDSLHHSTKDTHQNWVDTKIVNDLASIHEWLDQLEQTSSQAPFVIFEHTGTYSCRLAHCLSIRNIAFYLLTPIQSSGLAKMMHSIAKTDKADARLFYQYGMRMEPTPSVLEDESILHKRQLFKHLDTMKCERQGFENRLHALQYDPRANPSIVASVEQAIGFFNEQIASLEDQFFNHDDQDLAELEQKIMTIVGIGPKSAAAIITATNGFSNFDDAKQVAKFLGVCSSDHDSGTTVRRRGTIPKSSSNAYVRNCLYMAARSARKHNRACKALFERLRAKGKPFRVAMIAVVHKLVRQAFAIVKNNSVFDNNLACAK